LPSGTYTVSNLLGKKIYIQFSSGDYSNSVEVGGTKTFTYDGVSYLRFIGNDQSASESVTYKVMLNPGDTALPYEPYFEGLRSAPVTEVESVGINILCGDVLADKLVEVAGATKDEAAGTVTFSATKISGTTTFANFKTDTQYTFIFYGINTNNEQNSTNLKVEYTDGTSSSALRFSNSGADSYCVFVSEAGKSIKRIHGSEQTGSTILHYDKCGIFEGVLTEADFKPYVRNTLPIPEAVRNIDGYGWGINESIYNYVDFEKKQFVKRVGKTVFDGSADEAWTHDTYSSNLCFRVPLRTSTEENCALCSHFKHQNYPYTTPTGTKGIFGWDSSFEGVYFASEQTSTNEWRAWLSANPVTVYYQLAEPEITDISDLLPDDNFIGVEGGGTVTMVSEYGYDVPSKVMFYEGSNRAIGSSAFVGDLAGVAARAEADGEGRRISDTYVTKAELEARFAALEVSLAAAQST
jgi:hypothetical protein